MAHRAVLFGLCAGIGLWASPAIADDGVVLTLTVRSDGVKLDPSRAAEHARGLLAFVRALGLRGQSLNQPPTGCEPNCIQKQLSNFGTHSYLSATFSPTAPDCGLSVFLVTASQKYVFAARGGCDDAGLAQAILQLQKQAKPGVIKLQALASKDERTQLGDGGAGLLKGSGDAPEGRSKGDGWFGGDKKNAAPAEVQSMGPAAVTIPRVEADAAPAPAAPAPAAPRTPVPAPAPRGKERRDTAEREVITIPEGTMVIRNDKAKEKKSPAFEPEPPAPPAASGLKAGASDDNLQFNAFLKFAQTNANFALRNDVSRRTIVRVVDQAGLPIPNAKVMLRRLGQSLVVRRTYADGRCLLFPSESAEMATTGTTLVVEHGGKSQAFDFEPSRRKVEVKLDLAREQPSQVPLDIAFVLDTTGSMEDEIDRLKTTLDVIHFQISQLSPRPDVRFGMVLYKDHDDEYLTEVVPFTRDLKTFRIALNNVIAGGGGDTPEDVQAALDDTIHKLAWRETGAKLAFLVGDAAPHLDYGQRYTYVHAMKDAAKLGIKITAIGASGLPLDGELVWRQIAQYTMAPFVFLTYGEKGDSAGGTPSTVSHHVGSNWVADNLEAIIIRVVKVELAHYSPKGSPQRDDFFTAAKSSALSNELVLQDLFDQSVKQLTDYAVERIDDHTPTVVLPVADRVAESKPMADRLATRLELAINHHQCFRLLEKKQQAALTQQLSEQFEAKYDESRLVELGKLVPARLAVLGELDTSNAERVELLVKLVRLETGEVLSLSLLRIDRGLL